MANTAEIRRHIAAVKQTRTITNAMHLVASSRMRRVLTHIESNHAYFVRVQSAMKDIMQSPHNVTHPYLTMREGSRRTYIVVAADKGMAGPYNLNILTFAEQEMERHPDTQLITVGIVASEYFRSHGNPPDIEITGMIQDPSLHNARTLAFDVLDLYDNNLTDEVHIIYTSFYGSTKGRPVMRRLLPLLLDDYADVEVSEPAHEILYLPSAQEVFTRLAPQYIIGMSFGMLVQSYASEHFARMSAMQSATKSADDMLKQLKQEYNMARQAAITQEITEIAAAAEDRSKL